MKSQALIITLLAMLAPGLITTETPAAIEANSHKRNPHTDQGASRRPYIDTATLRTVRTRPTRSATRTTALNNSTRRAPERHSTRRPKFTNSHYDKPVCKDRNRWRFIAEKSVMPKVYTIRFLPDIFPSLYDFITGPDGREVARGIPQNVDQYRNLCLQLCLNETEFQCRFFAFVAPYLCIEAQHTNEFQTNTGFSNPFFEVPRVCLPNDGCKMVGEYFADSFSRCHFYQCAPGEANTLRATQHECPRSTVTRDTFITSRDMPYFTQPCSEFGSECMRTFPLFAP